MNGTTFKTCSCRDAETGKRLGKACLKLRRPGGGERWRSTHGRWAYQLELPPHADGRWRNPLRRRGFATLEEVEAELERARARLALDEDPHIQRKVTELLLSMLKDTKALPPVEEVRRKVRTRQDLNPTVTVAEWMQEFLRRKRKIDAITRRSYEAHIRLYFIPYLGDIRLRLRCRMWRDVRGARGARRRHHHRPRERRCAGAGEGAVSAASRPGHHTPRGERLARTERDVRRHPRFPACPPGAYPSSGCTHRVHKTDSCQFQHFFEPLSVCIGWQSQVL
ncbi:hypothetical protein [Nonomuraea zeae]|uniref:Core-binding (CB) domain-containing protein n=1 Tax=Nonomuraea zeae TaxID=1642303 RepID=A0A5S4F0T0_9ACTN|nr:hypothetical protein [Nonomuraea zeae]TMR09456.1 hypothetical protein ETD85_61400 [Nonomuraea zeae]